VGRIYPLASRYGMKEEPKELVTPDSVLDNGWMAEKLTMIER
jgi:hypothetical protein